MKVPFLNLRIQDPSIRKEIEQAISEAIDNSNFISGFEETEFERSFANYCQAKYCIGLNSGTDALFFTLKALNIKEGDKVIIPVNTFMATAEAISQIGAEPLFVDVDDRTYNMNTNYDVMSDLIRKDNTIKAIIPVHLYGQPAELDFLKSVLNPSKIHVIEDACQAHGAAYKNQRVGSISKATAFSFYPGKNLGAFGDGGALVTNDEEIFNKIKLLKNHGQSKKYEHDVIGYNSRLDVIQAKVLNIKLKYLDICNLKRIRNALIYQENLKNEKNIILPYQSPDSFSVFHLFVVRIKNREKIQKLLLDKGIETGLHYPKPLHLQKAYRNLAYSKGDFPIAEKHAEEILSLPMYPDLTRQEIDYVCQELINAVKMYE